MLLAGQVPRLKFKHSFEKNATRKLYMALCGSAIGTAYGSPGVETSRAKAQWQTRADCGRLPGILWVLREEEDNLMGRPVVHFEIGCRDSKKTHEFYTKM